MRRKCGFNHTLHVMKNLNKYFRGLVLKTYIKEEKRITFKTIANTAFTPSSKTKLCELKLIQSTNYYFLVKRSKILIFIIQKMKITIEPKEFPISSRKSGILSGKSGTSRLSGNFHRNLECCQNDCHVILSLHANKEVRSM